MNQFRQNQQIRQILAKNNNDKHEEQKHQDIADHVLVHVHVHAHVQEVDRDHVLVVDPNHVQVVDHDHHPEAHHVQRGTVM